MSTTDLIYMCMQLHPQMCASSIMSDVYQLGADLSLAPVERMARDIIDTNPRRRLWSRAHVLAAALLSIGAFALLRQQRCSQNISRDCN